MTSSEDDWADRHVARWRDHWVDIRFDDEVEAIWIRMLRLLHHLKGHTRTAVAQVGLQEFEYQTLHNLMIRDTPGRASPSALAEDLGISAAGMTGRLDSLETAGWIQRRPSPDDRRRVEIEVTRTGADVWRRAMDLRGRHEEELLGTLSPQERSELARLLKKVTLVVEAAESQNS